MGMSRLKEIFAALQQICSFVLTFSLIYDNMNISKNNLKRS